MTAPIKPAAAGLYGKDNWYLVTTIASTSLIPTALEVNAVSSLDVTDMLFPDTGTPAQTTNRVSRERRYGDTTVGETLGTSQLTGGTFRYAFDPQAAAASDGKKAFEKLGGTAGVGTIYLVNRRGIAKATTPAASQFVDAYKISVGPSFPAKQGEGESSEAAMVAEFAVESSAINVQLT